MEKYNRKPKVSKALPKELDNYKAKGYFNNAKEYGFVDDHYQFVGTKYQMAYFAELMGEKLNLKPKWKPFEKLWNYKYFTQTRHESKERFGKVERANDIEAIFKS